MPPTSTPPPSPAAGGLPIGMGGRAVSLLSGGIDSPVASWMIAKPGRGAGDGATSSLLPIPPSRPQDKVLELARLLTPWTAAG